MPLAVRLARLAAAQRAGTSRVISQALLTDSSLGTYQVRVAEVELAPIT